MKSLHHIGLIKYKFEYFKITLLSPKIWKKMSNTFFVLDGKMFNRINKEMKLMICKQNFPFISSRKLKN